MKIAIDGFELDGNFTGVGRYLKNLLKSMLELDRNNSYTLFKRDKSDPFEKKNLRIVPLSSSTSHTRWQNTLLLKALNREKFDLFFSPNHTIPLLYRGRSFMTVHDVSWKGVPEDFSFKERLSRDIRTKYSLKRCEKIFTVSEYSKAETEKYYDVSPEKIIAIPSGIEKSFSKATDYEKEEFRKRYDLNNCFSVGFLGSMFRRRNIPNLINSFLRLKKDHKMKLILVGKLFHRDINQYLADPDIIHIERIPEKDITSFYSSIDLFAYLSEYEGFGFPPLEALMCGTIPLLLKSSSLKEIFKNISVFIDNTHPDSISQKISEIMLNKEMFNKLILSEFGRIKNSFSWDAVAGKYLQHFLA